MMDDIKFALLGDRDAARRLTDAGVLIPCPGCGGEHNRCWWHFGELWVECDDCGWKGPTAAESDEARLAWNTRAPILSAEEMERLEATNEHDAQRVRG